MRFQLCERAQTWDNSGFVDRYEWHDANLRILNNFAGLFKLP